MVVERVPIVIFVLSVSTSLLIFSRLTPKEVDLVKLIVELLGVVGELIMTSALLPVAVNPVLPVRLLMAVLIAAAVVLLSAYVIVPDIKLIPSTETPDKVLVDRFGAEMLILPDVERLIELLLGVVAEEIVI